MSKANKTKEFLTGQIAHTFEASWSADEFKENQGYTEKPCPGRGGKQKIENFS